MSHIIPSRVARGILIVCMCPDVNEGRRISLKGYQMQSVSYLSNVTFATFWQALINPVLLMDTPGKDRWLEEWHIPSRGTIIHLKGRKIPENLRAHHIFALNVYNSQPWILQAQEHV